MQSNPPSDSTILRVHRIPDGGHGWTVNVAVGLPSLGQHVQRASDIAAAIIGLMLFSPLLLITSIAIKIESAGPFLARKTLRDEINKRSIVALRFRVVTTYTEGNQICQRATYVGQMLTQSGIDELPQLINVLRGQMSIVGRRNVYRWPARIP